LHTFLRKEDPKGQTFRVSKLQEHKNLVEFLLEAGRFPCALAHKIKLRTADFGVALDHNLVDARGTQQEGTLYADPVTGYPANGEIGVVPALAQADNDTFEFLDAFAVALFDLYMDADHVTGAKLGNFLVYWGFYRLQNLVCHFDLPYSNDINFSKSRKLKENSKTGVRANARTLVFGLPTAIL
jgi:hypothetical protein